MRTSLAPALVLATLLSAAAGGGITSPNELRILLPLYAYPEWWDAPAYRWDEVAAQGANAPITAILNPDNGPGIGFPNSDYVVGMADLAGGGVRMIGYVYTSYGARPLTNVFADIDAYAASTNITGIFVDECASGTNLLAYYTQVYAHVRGTPGLDLVVVNPGTHIAEAYLSAPAADVAVIFENESGWTNYVADGYVAGLPPSRFAALPFAVPDAAGMESAVDLAVQRNVGWIYVTDDDLPNPWDAIPPYWTNLAALVAAYRRTAAAGVASTGAQLRLDWSLPPGRPFVVEAAAAPGGWTPVTATLTSGPAGAAVSLPATNAASAFRLRLFP